MAFQNQVTFATAPSPDDWSTAVAEICYARLYENDWENAIEAHRYVLSAFRLDKDMTVARANWWLKNILERCPPELKEGFTVSRTKSAVADIVRMHWGKQFTPWIDVCFDGSVLGGTEIYMMLSLLRYPQEQVPVVNRTRLLMKKYGFAFDMAYLFAGSADDHSGHGMICSNTWVDMKNYSKERAREICETYQLRDSMADCVEQTRPKGSFMKNNRKDTANRYFQPKGTRYNAWGQGHVIDRNAKYQKGYVEPEESEITLYWLNKFGYEPLKKA
jgi:hypothetical protein